MTGPAAGGPAAGRVPYTGSMGNVPEHQPMDQHPDGQRTEVGGHMCPECGIPPSMFCTTCWGTGGVSTEGLAQWQQRKFAEGPT